ncbi:MAG: radical SAM protein [Planctomycetaceae bacterium]|nr:radical SAM protein [Planctomycetaceae bacterium]
MGLTSDSTPTGLRVALKQLEHLWFQVAGTRCNLSCHHCFISCHPANHSFGFLSRAQIQRQLKDSVAMGVKEYYFTGGEPFLNPEMVPILIETLEYGPATVLTNGTVLRDSWLQQLVDAELQSRYSLEFRVSIDGVSPEQNDPIRGEGTFDRAMEGVTRLARFGFLPIVTIARSWPLDKEDHIVEVFADRLRRAGCDRPRLKILPMLQLGAEVTRSGPYAEGDRITEEMLVEFDRSQLICDHSRIVSDRGIHVCPILIESPDSLLGENLAEADRSFSLEHGACWTCYQHGAICSNPSQGK